MTFDEVEALLLSEDLRILSARHNAKSDTASSFYLEMEGGWQAKFRVVADLSETRRNEDPKREVASYVLSRLLYPEGGIVKPCVFRRFKLEMLLPLVSLRASGRLCRWAGAPCVPKPRIFSAVTSHRAPRCLWTGGQTATFGSWVG
jgi:hypothetical protein